MCVWVNLVKKRLIVLYKETEAMKNTRRYNLYTDIARNYRLLDIQQELERIIIKNRTRSA